MEKIVRITSPYFCCGIIVVNKKVTEAAPIVKYMIGWSSDKVREYCKFKSWRTELVMSRKPVHEQVAEQLANSSPQIEKGVVDALVKRQLDKRTDALVKVYDDMDRLKLDLRKMKPDLVSCNEAGDVIESNWTPSTAKARKELVDKIEKYQRSLDKAHDKNDFADVFNLANAKSAESKGESKDT